MSSSEQNSSHRAAGASGNDPAAAGGTAAGGSEAGQAAPQFPLQSIDSENFQATTPIRKEKIHHTCMMMGLH